VPVQAASHPGLDHRHLHSKPLQQGSHPCIIALAVAPWSATVGRSLASGER
jgi:hypothetical protein